MKTSTRLDGVQASLTLEITDRAKQLQRAGIDVISLAAGEPDFAPPEVVNNAAIDAIQRKEGRYTAVAGTPALRRAIGRRFEVDLGIKYDPDAIIVSSGAKQALFNALFVLCDVGSEVIVPRPYWTSYPEIAMAIGVTPVFWDQEAGDGFRLDAEALGRLITPKTRAIILNSPNNPTGVVASADELRAVAEVLKPWDIWVISDDIYDKLVFPGRRFASILTVAPHFADRTIVVNGLSKTYCMTGWRVGFAAGPRDVIRGMEIIQGHTTSCANAIAQAAGQAALEHTDAAHLEAMVREYGRRAAFVHDALMQIEGVHSNRSQSSFYAFPCVDAWFGSRLGERQLTTASALCSALLDEAHVAVIPGEAFGYPRGVRLSYATSMEQLQRAMERIARFFARLER